MNQFSSGWASFVIRNRLVFLIATLLLIVAAPLSFHRLYHDSSNESYFVENDPHLESFNNLVDKFGDPEYLVVGIAARPADEDVFNAETLQMIDALTVFLEDHRHVTQVRSLSNYQYTHDDNGVMATDDLLEDVESLGAQSPELQHARKIMMGEQLALDTLITRDFRHTQIVARSAYLPGENTHKVELVHELQAFIAEQGYSAAGFHIRLSGMPVIGERFEVLTQNDMAWINPTMSVIMLAILFIIFRSIFATLVPMVVILTTMLLVTSLQGWLKWPFTAVNSALIPTVIILCMGTCIHVLVEFFQFRFGGKAPADAARETVNDLFYAVLFTCITTSMGFIALSVTELKPVREFAVLAAIAPMVIFTLSMTTLPAILSYVRWIPRNRRLPQGTGSQSSEAILAAEGGNNLTHWLTQHIPLFTFRKRKSIALIGVLVSLFSVYGVTYMRVDANIINYFKENSWMNQDLHYFNDVFKGISNLEVIVDTQEPGGIKNPDILKRVDELQVWLESFEETGNPTSVIDFYKQINQSLHSDDPAWYLLPTTREMAAQFLLLYENTGPNEDLTDLKDFDEQYLRVRVPVLNMDESEVTRLMETLYAGMESQFSDLEIELTGNLVMANAQNRYVNNGMFRSFGIAILVIGFSFIVLFRSFKYGVIALVPSLVPVLLTGGLVSLVGVPMDLGTMIVGAMTIGIAVDDSIHLMSRYLLMRRRNYSIFEAVQFAMNSSGRAVILTSIVLVSGFSVMLLGSFVSYIYVGLFSAMIMSLALIGDILFMPALLYLFDGSSENIPAEETRASQLEQRLKSETPLTEQQA